MKKKFTKILLLFVSSFILGKTSTGQIITLLNEDFSSNSFATNGWSFPNGQGNWSIGSSSTPSGAVAPNAYFNWTGTNTLALYTVPLLSNTVNATSITGPVTLDYLLLFNPYSTATLEQFKVEYKDVSSSTWTLLANYTNSITSLTTWTVSNMSLPGVSGQNFQIRFTAYGINSFSITRWSLDNIVVRGTSCLASLPSITIASTPTICSGRSATLTAFGGGTSYTWSPAGGNGSVAIVSPTANTTYALVSSMIGCSVTPVSAVTTITVFANTTSLTTSSSSSAICSGNSVTLTAGGASSYSWSSGATSSLISVSPTITSTYSVSNTNSLGCVATKTLSVIVNQNPAVTAFSTSSLICSGAVNNLIAGGATTYSWNNGANSGIITVTPQVSTIYTVTGTDALGCFSSATINVLVSPPVTVAASNTSICSGGSATLTANGALSYIWSNNASGNILLINPLQNTTYVVTGTNNIGCVTSSSMNIQVNPNPTVSAISSSSAICKGSTATLTANGASTYTWSNSLSGITTTVSPLVNTNYTVSGTSAAGCTGANNTATIALVVNSNPTVTAIGSSTVLCSGLTLSLIANGASTYSWNFGGTVTTATIVPAGTTTYSVVGTNTQLCSSTGTVGVTIIPSPSLSIASNTTDICVGATATLLATGAQTYTWSTGSTVNVVYVSPQNNTGYTVTGTGLNNCISTKTINIQVNQYPLLMGIIGNSIVCAGESTNLSASGALTYSWSTGATGSLITVSPSLTTTYTVEGSNNGCNASIGIVQQVDECTGILKNESPADFFTVFPNPSNGIFKVEFNSGNTDISMELYSISGLLIRSEKVLTEKFLLDLNTEANGLYYLKASAGENQSVIKIIKIN